MCMLAVVLHLQRIVVCMKDAVRALQVKSLYTENIEETRI